MLAMLEKSMIETKADLEAAAENMFDEEGRFVLADEEVERSVKHKYTPAPTPQHDGVPTLPPGNIPDYANLPLNLGALGKAGAAGALKRLMTSQEDLLTDSHQFELVTNLTEPTPPEKPNPVDRKSGNVPKRVEGSALE